MCVCVSEPHLRQSTQGQIKSLDFSTSLPFSLPSHLKKPHQVNLSLRSCVYLNALFCSLRLQMSWSSCFNKHVYENRVPAACSCVKCGSADVDDLIRDFGLEVIDISLWDGHIDLVICNLSRVGLGWAGGIY